MIVGAGISGLAAAHFWRRALGNDLPDPARRQPRRLRRPREAQRVHVCRPDVPRVRRHDEHCDALSVQLHREAADRGARHRRAAQRGSPESRSVPEAAARLGDVLRQGALRRRPARGRQRSAALGGVRGQDAAVGAGTRGSRPPVRHEPRLHAGDERGAEDGGSRLDQLPGFPAAPCARYAGPHSVLHGPGRTQQQARRHDARARSGEARFTGLRRARPRPEEEFREGSYTFHFPDGNATIARLLVSRLLPDACAGESTVDGIIHASIALRETGLRSNRRSG